MFSLMHQTWWKVLATVLLLYTLIAGLLMPVPARPILHETIRNLYFHVPMWFSMILLMLVSLAFSIRYLSSGKEEDDLVAAGTAHAGICFGILGVLTGSVWAKFTWSHTPFFSIDGWWVNDPKLNGAVVTLLVYFAYFVLRNAVEERERRARIAAVYSIFAYTMLIVFLLVMPRMKDTDSLHPGNGGNPGFNIYDLDGKMRMVFYPAVVGWFMLGLWIASLRIRSRWLEIRLK